MSFIHAVLSTNELAHNQFYIISASLKLVLIRDQLLFYILISCYRMIKIQALQAVTFLLFCNVVASVNIEKDTGVSEFVAAVYEHAFVTVENRTTVSPRKEARAIIMQNMDIYEEQMQKAKQQVKQIIVAIMD